LNAFLTIAPACLALAASAAPNDILATNPTIAPSPDGDEEQLWNWHLQNTFIVQYHPHFHASYSGPHSLPNVNEVKETVSLDFLVGVRLWCGAEFHVDGLMWQGFGLGDTLGVDAFPNGEAFRLGTAVPNVNLPRVFVRQTINLGGEQESVEDDQLHLKGTRDSSRVTLTLGRISAKDIFDNNTYANDPRTQFMNWALMANEAWDYPGDSLGYMNGFAAELNQPGWAIRYGVFQMPRVSNGTALDWHVLKAWGMVTELERRYSIANHPGAIRLLAFLNQAHMGSYQAALDSNIRPADIEATRAYRYKYGFGLNLEQELAKNLGAFARLGWSDGENEAWVFSDVDRTATVGLSLKGEAWHRADDTFGIAGVLNGLSKVHREFLAAGGLGILAGDSTLSYGWEQALETYYDFGVWKTMHASLDYQFINCPAFNRDRGPVSVFALRLHWEL
jgi:high affinity Mn2+ porin